MKIILYLMLAVVQLVAAVFGFFILLIGLNGYSERQATPSLIFYIVLSVVTVLGDGWLSFLFVRILTNKTKLGTTGAAVIGTISVLIFGIVVLTVGLFAAFLLAEIVRGIR